MGFLDKLLKAAKPKEEVKKDVAIQPKPKVPKEPTERAVMKFNVVGIGYDNKDGSSRWKIIDKFAKDKFTGKPYAGATKDAMESGEYFYQYTKFFGYGGIEFIQEPDNEYSDKAIMVVLTGYGQIGYVPEDDIDRFNKAMDKGNYKIGWRIGGGRIKDDEGVREEDYNVTIRLFKK